MAIGKLTAVPLRELWKHEERGFSAWLENNIETLAEVLGTSLSVVQREKSTGSFQVDLIAEDHNGDLVVIENQLGATDHDHLGKVLTYLVNLDAKTAVWITSNPRPEHLRAIEWLNECTPADIAFYLVRLAAYRIGGSDAAPLFSVIAAPSTEAKAIGKRKKELGERHVLRLEFWEALLKRAKEKGFTLHANRSPTPENWIAAGSGKTGMSFNYYIWFEGQTAAELYIDTGDKEQNKRIFDQLHDKKASIEERFGGTLLWERLDDRIASRVRVLLHEGGLEDKERWTSIHDSMIDAMSRLYKALKPHIQGIHLET